MNRDDFENKLERQQLRRLPADWREEILSAAREASPHPAAPIPQRSWLAILTPQLSTLLWPSPKAWAALAAAWVLVFAIQLSLRDEPALTARHTNPASPEMRMVLEQQKRLLAKLVDWPSTADIERPGPTLPRPRCERREEERVA